MERQKRARLERQSPIPFYTESQTKGWLDKVQMFFEYLNMDNDVRIAIRHNDLQFMFCKSDANPP